MTPPAPSGCAPLRGTARRVAPAARLIACLLLACLGAAAARAGTPETGLAEMLRTRIAWEKAAADDPALPDVAALNPTA